MPVMDGVSDVRKMLTAREREVMKLLDSNLSYSQIGSQLIIGSATVKTHVKHIMAKAGVHRRLDLVRWYRDGMGRYLTGMQLSSELPTCEALYLTLVPGADADGQIGHAIGHTMSQLANVYGVGGVRYFYNILLIDGVLRRENGRLYLLCRESLSAARWAALDLGYAGSLAILQAKRKVERAGLVALLIDLDEAEAEFSQAALERRVGVS